MNSEDDVVDRIDKLVNESLSKSWDDISGYDNDINQPECRCGGAWHGLPTWRCPGTDTEGPLRPTGWQVTVGGGDSDGYTIDALQDARQGFARRSAQDIADAFLEAITGWPNPMLHTTPGGRRYLIREPAGDQAVHPGEEREWPNEWTFDNQFPRLWPEPGAPWVFDPASWLPLGTVDPPAARGLAQHLPVAFQPFEPPEPETPQQHALPQPATTPPMWAQQPNQTRRTTNRYRRPRT